MDNSSTRIEVIVKTANDKSFSVKKTPLLRFTNTGQSRVWIDETVVLEPKESFIEADEKGDGITHTYDIKFIALSSPPAIDFPVIFTGNRLHIRKHNRVKDV